MYSMILEVKFAYVVVRLFVYDLTSKHVPNKRVIRCTNKLPIVNMVMHCQRPIMQCALLMNINYNGYFTQWLRITQLRNESQSQTFLRNNISIFGKLSFRQNVRSAKRPFGKTSVGKMSVRQNVFRQNVFRQSVFRQNVRVPPVTGADTHHYAEDIQRHNHPI